MKAAQCYSVAVAPSDVMFERIGRVALPFEQVEFVLSPSRSGRGSSRRTVILRAHAAYSHNSGYHN
eukprot:6178744-Pleurochrysis_carterae.AAC.2